MLVKVQEGRPDLKVEQARGVAVQVWIEEVVVVVPGVLVDDGVDDEGVAVRDSVVEGGAVDDLMVGEIVEEGDVVDDLLVDDAAVDACVKRDWVKDDVAVDETEEDIVVEYPNVDDTAVDDATDDAADDDTAVAENDALDDDG